MKRILSLFLSFIMIFTLTACSSNNNNVDHKQVVIDAMEKTDSLEYQDCSVKMVMNVMGMDLEMPIDTKVIAKDGVPTAMSVYMEVSGSEVNMSFVDDYIYLDMADTKVKCAATMDDFLEISSNNDYIVDAEAIDTVTYKDNGVYVLTLTDKALNQLASTLGNTLGETSGISFSNQSYNVTVDDNGYLSDYSLTMDLTVEAEGYTMECSCAITATYNNIGETFEINAPADESDYIEYDYSDLMGE